MLHVCLATVLSEVHGLDVESRHDDLLVGQDWLEPVGCPGGEDDAAPAEIDLDSPQVCSVERRAKHHGHLGQVAQQYPLPDIAKSTQTPSTLTRSSSDDNVES